MVVALWLSLAFIGAGAGITLGVIDSLGEVPLTWASATTNLVGVTLTVAWFIMASAYTRRAHRCRQ